jgi:hypothetical protein
MNLRYREDRRWLIFGLTTILVWVLPHDYVPFYFGGWIIYGVVRGIAYRKNPLEPAKENSRKFDPAARITWLEKQKRKADPYGVLKKEILYLKEKYQLTSKSAREEVKVTKTNNEQKAKAAAVQSKVRRLGDFVPLIICPHCQDKGKVRRTTKARLETTRDAGIVGGLIGQAKVTNKGRYTQLFCENCKTTWEA